MVCARLHKRPISVNQINQLVDEVETEIFNREEKEIPSSLIGELVMDKLKDLEAVAYVRFASVYREIQGRQHVYERAEKNARQIRTEGKVSVDYCRYNKKL